MFKSIITELKTVWAESESVRRLADLTDRELQDVGADRFDAKLLSKAQRYRAREHVTFHQGSGFFAHPNA